MLNSKRIFQLFLVGFAVFSLLVSSDVIHGGVTASVIRPLDVAPTGGGGGGGGGCNPNNYVLYGTRYTVKILDAETDRGEYAHGDTVTFTGTVQLAAEPVYINDCYQYLVGDAYNADPSVVSVALSGPFGDLPAENSGQYFKAEVTVPLKADAGTVSYHVTATYGSSSDATDVSFKVAEYVPVLTVKTWHGFVYPGEQFTVSGSNWKPDGDVALDYGGLGSGTGIVGPSGSFPELTVTVPETQKEGPYTITGTEEGLEAHSTVVVRWRQLVITITELDPGPSMQQGDAIGIIGTVTDNEGKPVAGAAMTMTTSRDADLVFNVEEISSSTGSFTAAAAARLKASPGTILITVTAQKTPGYLMGTASLTLQVTCRPYGLDAACPAQIATPGNAATAAAGLTAGVATAAVAAGSVGIGDGGEEGETEGQQPPPPDDPCREQELAYREALHNVNDMKLALAQLIKIQNELEQEWNSYYVWAKSWVNKTWDGGKLVVKGTAGVWGGAVSEVAHGYEIPGLIHDVRKEGLWGLLPDVMKEPEDLKKLRERIKEINEGVSEARKNLEAVSEQLDKDQQNLDLCHDMNQYKSWYKKTHDGQDAPKLTPTPTPQQTEEVPVPPDESPGDWVYRKLDKGL